MSNIKIEHPWMLLLLIPALALILIPFLKLPRRRRKNAQRIVPVVLHCVLALLLTLLIAGFSIVRTTDNQAVILVLDYSDSTRSVQDSIKADARQLQKLIKNNTPVHIVAFGGDCVYEANNIDKLSPVDTQATDLSAALEYAASMLPDDRAGRIILLSDGRQTDGDAAITAQYLKSQGVRIDALWFDSTVTTAEVQVSNLTAPSSAFAGNTVSLTAEIESNTETTVSVTLFDGETKLETQSVSLTPGTKVLSLEAPAGESGTHNYQVVLQSTEDTIPENNQAVACVAVAQAPKVLIITGIDTDAAPLQTALAGSAETTVCAAPDAPRKIHQLCDYDGVILMNVHTDDLPKHYMELLETYVSQHGRSLIALGGEETFMYGAMKDTVLEDMMPVDFALSRTSEDDSVALMLVIDCSLSMSQQSAYMSLAKQGAIKCVGNMTENDYVGIISFNQDATVEAPLAKNTDAHKASLNRIISSLTTSQGTYYTDAFALAHQELLKSDAPIRHILFVSDGGPADTSYKELIPGIAADGINISTVALSYSSSILSEIAENCGGSYYLVQEATDLPDIMLSLTQNVSVNSYMTGNFAPTVVENSPLAQTLPGELPALSGYLGTTMKRGAACHITLGDDHPLYASWTYGNGTVACFTSDLSNTWSSQWMQNKNLVQTVVTYALPQSHNDSALLVTAQPGGQSVDITVNTPTTDEATISIAYGDTETKMRCIAPGVFQYTVPGANLGGIPVTVTHYDKNGEELDQLNTILCIPVRKEYDCFGDNGQAMLKGICMNGGGILAAGPEGLTQVTAEAISAVKDFRILFGIAFVVLLLADIAIRKLKWKDLKNIWLTLTRK